MPRRSYAPNSVERTITLFWLQVDQGEPDQCWDWQGYAEEGYGRFFFDGKMQGAHVLALEWFSGEARIDGFDTCHSCNRPICCNPHHLRFDTRRGNVGDSLAAGTHNWQTQDRKLTNQDVVNIRLRAASGASGSNLARDYALTTAMVSMIITGRRYPHLGGPIRPPRQRAVN